MEKLCHFPTWFRQRCGWGRDEWNVRTFFLLVWRWKPWYLEISHIFDTFFIHLRNTYFVISRERNTFFPLWTRVWRLSSDRIDSSRYEFSAKMSTEKSSSFDVRCVALALWHFRNEKMKLSDEVRRNSSKPFNISTVLFLVKSESLSVEKIFHSRALSTLQLFLLLVWGEKKRFKTQQLMIKMYNLLYSAKNKKISVINLWTLRYFTFSCEQRCCCWFRHVHVHLEFPFYFQATSSFLLPLFNFLNIFHLTLLFLLSNQIEKFRLRRIFFLNIAASDGYLCVCSELEKSLISTFRLNWFHGSERKSWCKKGRNLFDFLYLPCNEKLVQFQSSCMLLLSYGIIWMEWNCVSGLVRSETTRRESFHWNKWKNSST